MKLKDVISEIIWDKGNLSAVNSYTDNEPKEKYKIVINEPFTYETTKSADFYTMRQLLYDADADFDYSTEKI